VVCTNATGPQIEAAIESESQPFQVIVIWYLTSNLWTYYLPQFPGSSTLTVVSGPMGSIYAVLQ